MWTLELSVWLKLEIHAKFPLPCAGYRSKLQSYLVELEDEEAGLKKMFGFLVLQTESPPCSLLDAFGDMLDFHFTGSKAGVNNASAATTLCAWLTELAGSEELNCEILSMILKRLSLVRVFNSKVGWGWFPLRGRSQILHHSIIWVSELHID